jgi:large subunit ribosomal protein L24
MKIRKGDTVFTIIGKDKGKKGKVQHVFLNVIPPRIIVEGVNVAKKSLKPTQHMPQGGIVEKELAFSVSKVMLVCPSCNQPTRIGKKLMATGKNARFCRKCGELIDKD